MTPIESLHIAYQNVTGLEVRLPVWERSFSDFLAHGFTESDLVLVLTYLKRENKRMNGAAYSLRLDKLLDFEYRHFDGLLSEAKSKDRNRIRTTPAKRVVAQFRGCTETHSAPAARTVGEILKGVVQSL